METLGLTASQIVANRFCGTSSWHFAQARAWLDLAKRMEAYGPIHYSAMELRYGVEYLLFELLVLASETFGEAEYRQCLGDPKAMKQLLNSGQTKYQQLAEFTELILRLDTRAPSATVWHIGELFRFWGIASEKLHFCGSHSETYGSKSWVIAAIARLEEVIERVWKEITTTKGVAIMRPSQMTPVVRGIWEDFSTGKIDREQAAIRLNLVQPVSARQMGH